MARILITGFCSVPSPGRPGVQLGHIVEGLHRQHQVDVLSLRREDQGHVERIGGTRFLRVPVPDGDMASQIEMFRRALRRQIEGADYDIVHFRDGWSGLTALELQASQGFATVFDLARSPMAEPVLTDLATATELERAEQACVRRADLVLAPTEPSRQYLAGFTSASKIHVVPPGVNIDRFDWEDLTLDRAPIILYMGSLTPGRGVRVLLRAMLDVAAASSAVLVLAGPASESFMASLETAVHDLQLDGRVRLLGEVPHELVPAVISRATVCVAPGAAELTPKPTALFPTKILEYMACRRAVVAPARGTVNMLLRDKEEGLLFAPGDPDDLAAKLLMLLRDSKLRGRVAKGGYEMVRANCTASGTRRSLRRAYAWLAEQDQFRERLGQSATGDPRLAPITELGLNLSVRAKSQPGESENFVEETVGQNAAAASVNSPAIEVGEVTQVETAPLRDLRGGALDLDPPAEPEVGAVATTVAPRPVAPTLGEEGTGEWDVGLEVIEDTGSHDMDAGKPKTVITAPLDHSLVAGELRGKTPRPELTRPISETGFEGASETGFDGEPTTLSKAKTRAPIPPANLAARATVRGPAPQAFARTGSHEQDQTRVLAASDIDNIVTTKAGALASEEDEDSLARTQVALGAQPRPPKLPTGKGGGGPRAARLSKPAPSPSATGASSPRPSSPRPSSPRPESDDESQAHMKTRVVLAPIAPPTAAHPKPEAQDPKSPAPDDLS